MVFRVFEIVTALALVGALVFAFWPTQSRERSGRVIGTLTPQPVIDPELPKPFPQAAFDVVLWTPPPDAPIDSPQVADVPPPRLDLTLLAIEEHDGGRVAVFREPRTGGLFRLRPGESIQGVSVTEILEYEVVMTVQDRPVTRSLRRSTP